MPQELANPNYSFSGPTSRGGLDHGDDAKADRFGQFVPSVDDGGQRGVIRDSALSMRCQRGSDLTQTIIEITFRTIGQRT